MSYCNATFVEKGNKLVLRTKDQDIPVAKFVDNTVVLCPRFNILNALFTYPMIYISGLPRPIPMDSSLSSSYISTGIISNCPYLTFQPTQVQTMSLSRSVGPRFEIIQLFQTDLHYTFKYNVQGGSVSFYTIIPSDNQSYRLVDSCGKYVDNNLTGTGEFTTAYWTLIVVKVTSKTIPSVDLTISGKLTSRPIASIVGPIKLKICNECVIVATKNVSPTNNMRVPIPELLRLSNALFNKNRSLFALPCVGTFPAIDPPGPFAISDPVPDTHPMVNIPLVGLTAGYGSSNAVEFNLIFGAIPESPYWKIGNSAAGTGTALWLCNRDPVGSNNRTGTYTVTYNITVQYPQPSNTVEYGTITGNSFGLPVQDGPPFVDKIMCNGQIAIDTSGIQTNTGGTPIGTVTTIAYGGTFKFSTADGDYFLGFFNSGSDQDNRISTSGTFTLVNGDMTVTFEGNANCPP